MPDFVVTTPGSLASLLDGAGPAFSEDWTRAGLASWVRSVVLDEADLLLSGGYTKHLSIIMDLLRAGDRERAIKRVCAELGIEVEEFRELPRMMRKTAQVGGARGMIEAGYTPPGGGDGKVVLHEVPDEVRWKLQYLFVAATMPAEGDKTAGAEIAAAFPSAVWISGKQLHQSRRNVTHNWKKVGDDWDRMDALVVSPFFCTCRSPFCQAAAY